jgi:hypothetical protein
MQQVNYAGKENNMKGIIYSALDHCHSIDAQYRLQNIGSSTTQP